MNKRFTIGKFPRTRLRRNRQSTWCRSLISETKLSTNDLILPLFITEGKKIKDFFGKKKLANLISLSNRRPLDIINEMITVESYNPELNDLYRLYQFVLLNKRTTILEFGSGFSSLIFSQALKENKNKYKNDVKKLRRNNPFELFVVENEKRFLNITKRRIAKFRSKKDTKKNKNKKSEVKINFLFSECVMMNYLGNYATEYKKLPFCNPDFIYLDGPDQFNVKKDINGISIRHKDMMPMVCDILKFEHFYTPGTIIVCDGRAANAKFLKDHFKRNWKYINDKENDQHIFYLDDPLLGKYNKLQIEFYKK